MLQLELPDEPVIIDEIDVLIIIVATVTLAIV